MLFYCHRDGNFCGFSLIPKCLSLFDHRLLFASEVSTYLLQITAATRPDLFMTCIGFVFFLESKWNLFILLLSQLSNTFPDFTDFKGLNKFCTMTNDFFDFDCQRFMNEFSYVCHMLLERMKSFNFSSIELISNPTSATDFQSFHAVRF